ncbi:DNA-directed RNA polymerase subunit omega [Campylobacterota bacterium]
MRLEELTAKALEVTGADRYQLALAVAKRADQLQNGESSKLNVDPKTYKPADLALMELAEGVVSIKGFQA